MDTTKLMVLLKEKMSTFSKGQKAIANFILEKYDKAAFMTAAKLGVSAGVSESTVVRFASELGFDGYPALQKALLGMVRTKLTALQRMDVAENRIGDSNILSSVLEADIENIRATLNQINAESFERIVQSVLSAKKLYILGVRSSAALAGFLGFYFNLILDNVKVVNTSTASEIFEQILRIAEGDILIGISFPRYSKRTLKAISYAKSQGATVIGITDSTESPIVNSSDLFLAAQSDMASFVDSLVAPLSVINALIVAISMRKKQEISNTFEKLENIWQEYQVYENH